MPDDPVVCQHCSSGASWFDQYCGVCGKILPWPKWRVGDGRWHSDRGRVAVHPGEPSARVVFRNEGVVPAFLILRAEDIAQLPEWIDRRRLGERIIHLLPGVDHEAEIEIPLARPELDRILREDKGRQRTLYLEAPLSFLTNLVELQEGRWGSRPFRLTMAIARQPWLSPAGSLYRFLPSERLADPGFEHTVEIHNEAAERIELHEVDILEDPEFGPAGLTRLEAESVVHREEVSDPVFIDPGEIRTDRLTLRLDQRLAEGAVGWFSAMVEYALGYEGEVLRIRSQVRGTIGRGPTLELAGDAMLTVPWEKLEEKQPLTLFNPGCIPVRVVAVEVERQDGTPAPEPDWLVLKGIAEDDLVGAGERRSVVIRFDPGARMREEYDEAWLHRTVRIRHDGWPVPDRRQVTLAIDAQLGRVRECTAGLDFGTTNSLVCLQGEELAHPLLLELDTRPPGIQLPSLMYFKENPDPGGEFGRFLFGHLVDSYAGANPAHLVRSIKTLVGRDPKMQVFFLRKRDHGGYDRETKTSQDLLNIFIAELRRRAERGAVRLKRAEREDLGLEASQAVIRRAVFSHPAEVTDEMRQALMEAAHRTGINTSDDSESFAENYCADEATAAVLAYVDSRIAAHLAEDEVGPELRDGERILCFDMGGGTTDLAAVEVDGMRAHVAAGDGEPPRVVVRLRTNAGDRFGGDDLDVAVASFFLDHILHRSEEQGAPVILDEIREAIESRSYAEFFKGYQSRNRGSRRRPDSDDDIQEKALRIYNKAMEVLRQAEWAKRRLSEEDEAVDVTLSGTDWPRHRSEAEKAAAAENFEVRLARSTFEGRVRHEIRKRLSLLDGVVERADWEWRSVTTLLFSGQSVRIPALREEIINHVKKQRGEGGEKLTVVEPDDPWGFDPKHCVAIGAAILGRCQVAPVPWLELRSWLREKLTFDLQIRYGRVFRKLAGLELGTPLPAEAEVPVSGPIEELQLYRAKKLHVRFRFPKTTEVRVRVEGPADYWVIAGGKKYPGGVIS